MDTNDTYMAVVIATYKRTNGKTPEYLKRVANFLNEQRYSNFFIILIGDKYTDNEEFEACASLFPQDRLYYENRQTCLRDGTFKRRNNMWTSSGIYARFYGIQKAVELGFKFYAHLDDDDIWTKDHLFNLHNTITKFPEVDFLFTKSGYCKGYLPRETVNNISYNNALPRPCNIVHSSTCINLETIGDDIINVYNTRINAIERIKNGQLKEPDFEPLDIQKWNAIRRLHKEKKVKSIYIPMMTCSKDSDHHVPNLD